MPPKDPQSPRDDARDNEKHWGRRAAWFVGLWVAGVAVVFTVAYAIRLMIL
jgi:hypothetical protein